MRAIRRRPLSPFFLSTFSKPPQPWAPNARALRSLLLDLAARARTTFGSEVRFAVVDTGGAGGAGGDNSSNNGGGRAAASLAEQCGVRALPSFQIWRGGELQLSLGGAEAAAVVVENEEGEAAAAAAPSSSPGGGFAARLRSALSSALTSASASSSSSSTSSSSSSVSVRTRLAEELRARAGLPVPSSSRFSRALRPLFGPLGKVFSSPPERHRRALLAAVAAAGIAGVVLGSAKSARASRRWQHERYDWLPSEAHRRRERARAVSRDAERRAGLGGLSFLAPVRGERVFFFFFFKELRSGEEKKHSPLSFSFPFQ